MSDRKKLPKGWRLAPLTEGGLVEVDPKTDAPKDWDRDRIVSFLPMALVDEATGTVRDFERQSLASCSGGKSRFRNTDVLFAKITPCVQNGKIAIIESLPDSIGFGSTEFYVLRSGERLLPEYLWYFVRTSKVIERAVATFTGTSGRQRVPSTFWDDIEIPLPQLAVQERIVEVLQQADAIRRKRVEARRLADQILPALFLDMFGNPATNPKGWPVEPIGNLLAFETSQVRPEADMMYDYVAPEHIESGTGRFSGLHTVFGRELGSTKNRFTSEHVLYCKLRPYLNKVILPESTGICSTELIPLRPFEKISREFLAIFLRLPFFVAIATQKSQRTKMPRFGPSQMATERMIVPPDRLQHAFCETANHLLACINKAIDSQETSLGLFDGLLSRAFTGELTAEWEVANAEWIAERQTFYERLPRLALLSLLLEQRQRAGRKSVTLITALMKYAFLAQMEGELRRRLYRFVPYHYGPYAMELYNDLKALQADGLIAVQNDAEEDKTRITLTDPARAAALLDEEAMKDVARLAALEKAGENTETAADPAMSRLLKRRAETLETLRADAVTILDSYGNLDHNALLKMVYEKYPAYAKKSRLLDRGQRFTR